MFDNLDDPTPPPVSAAELARVRARAAAIRSARRRTLFAVGSSACAVVAVVATAAVVVDRHHGGRTPVGNLQVAGKPVPLATANVDAYGASSPYPAVSSPYPAVTSPLILQSEGPASPDSAAYAAAQRCFADAARMLPSYVPTGLKREFTSTPPSLGAPGSLASWSWSDNPGQLSKQTLEFDVTLFCQGHAEFGVTGGDGDRVTQDVTVSGKPAILWHEYNNTVVGVEFDWGGYGWVQVESQALAKGKQGTHPLSDAEVLAIARSLPAS